MAKYRRERYPRAGVFTPRARADVPMKRYDAFRNR
jgi:hypothetical protein